MLTASSASHIVQVRDAYRRETHALAALNEAQGTVRETNRRLRAEEAAEVLARRATVAEETALQALATVEDLESEKQDVEAELTAAQAYIRTQESEIADARVETLQVRSELQELKSDVSRIGTAAAAYTKLQWRALRDALAPWRLFARNSKAYHRLKDRRTKALRVYGFARLARFVNYNRFREQIGKSRAVLRSCFRRRGFWTWYGYAVTRVEQLTNWEAGGAAHRHKELTRMLQSWLGGMSRMSGKRRMRIAASMMRGDFGLRKGWNKLVAIYVAGRQLRIAMTNLRKRKERMAINQWNDVARWQISSSSALRTFRPSFRLMRFGFNTYHLTWTGLVRLRGAAMSVRHSCTRRGLSTWRYVLESRAHTLQVKQRAARIMIHRLSVRVFNSWSAARTSANEARRRLLAAAETWRGSNLRRAWNSVMEVFAFRALMRASLNNLCLRNLRAAMNTWRDTTDSLLFVASSLRVFDPEVRLRRAAFNSLREGLQEHERLKRAVMAIIHKSRHRAFTSWLSVLQSMAYQLSALKRAASAFWNRGFVIWVGFVHEALEARRRVSGGIAAWHGSSLRRGWYTLLETFSVECIVRTTINNMRLRHGRSALNQWRWIAQERKSSLLTAKAAFSALAPEMRMKRYAFNTYAATWMVLVQLRKSAIGVCQGGKLRALNTWRNILGSRVHQLEALKRAIRSFRKVQFHRWREYVHAVHEFHRHVRGTIGAWQGNGLRKAWLTWLTTHKASKYKMKGMLYSMTQFKLRAAFNEWSTTASDLMLWAHKHVRVATILDPDGNALRRTLERWSEIYEFEMQLREGAFLIMHRVIRRAFQELATLVRGHKLAESQTEANQIRAAKRLRNRELHRAFSCWEQTWSDLMNARRRAKGAILALKGDGLRKGWFTWQEAAAEAAQMKAKLAAFIHPGLRSALNTWLETLEFYLEKRRILRVAANEIWVGGGLHAAFEAIWRAANSANKMRGVAKSLLSSCIRRALNTWRGATASKQNAALGLLVAVRENKDRRLRAGWTVWRAMLIRDRLSELVTVRNALWMRPAFVKWFEWRRVARCLVDMGLGFSRWSPRKAWMRWISLWTHSVEVRRFQRYVRALTIGELVMACDRGDSLVKQLRHTGLRGVARLWRSTMMSPSLIITKWAHWKACTFRRTISRRFAMVVFRRSMNEGFDAIREAALTNRLVSEGTVKLGKRKELVKKLRTDLTAAEAAARLLRNALDEVQGECQQALAALEDQKRRADAAIQVERRAAVKAVANAKQVSPVAAPASPARFHRWSTAAARGHSKLPQEQFDKVFDSQYQAARRVSTLDQFRTTQAAVICSLRTQHHETDERQRQMSHRMALKLEHKGISAQSVLSALTPQPVSINNDTEQQGVVVSRQSVDREPGSPTDVAGGSKPPSPHLPPSEVPTRRPRQSITGGSQTPVYYPPPSRLQSSRTTPSLDPPPPRLQSSRTTPNLAFDGSGMD